MNNKKADQTARMRRLICDFVVRIWQKQVFSRCDSFFSSHVKEHLKEMVDKPKDQMTEEELEFHYFKLHDYDNNNKLDGVEIVKAITHFHAGKCFWFLNWVGNGINNMSQSMTKPPKLAVCPVKPHISLGINPVRSVFTVCMKKHWLLNIECTI